VLDSCEGGIEREIGTAEHQGKNPKIEERKRGRGATREIEK